VDEGHVAAVRGVLDGRPRARLGRSRNSRPAPAS
jgi:hypothetical protein